MGSPPTPDDYRFLREFLRTKIGHELGEGKEYLVESRFEVLAARLHLAGLPGVFERLRRSRDPEIECAVCEAMVTTETSFFRTASVFERLKKSVLPTLIRRRAAVRRLRIWSAGCSTGQEPYSVALMLLEDFPEVRRDWDVRILGTDLSHHVLRQATEGSYTANEIRRGLRESQIRTYFTQNDHRWTAGPELKRLVRFEQLNLLVTDPFVAEFDLILIRNVLIYFSEAARAHVFASLRRAIRDDGYLFLGESETILGQDTDFTFAEDGTDYYRPVICPSRVEASVAAKGALGDGG